MENLNEQLTQAQLLELGRTYQQKGQPEQALKYFQKAVALNPDELWPQLFLSEQLRDKCDFATALMILDTIEKKYPNHFEITLRRGHIHRAQGNHKQALIYFQQSYQLNSDHIWIRLALLDELRWHGEFGKAHELLNAFLIQEPTNIHFLLRNSHIFRELGQHEQTLTSLQQAIKIHPDNLQLRLELAIELRDQNELEQSVEEFNFLQKNHPPNFYVLFHLAQLYRRQGNQVQSLDYFNKSLNIDPNNIYGYIAIVEVLRENQQFETAQEKLAELEQRYPQRFEVWLQKGLLYREQNQHEQALSCFQQAYTLDNSNANALLQIANEQFNLGQIDNAVASLIQNLINRPNDLHTLLQIGNWLNIANAKEHALEYFQQALTAHPQQIHPYINVAQLLFDLGRINEAFNIFQQAIEQCGERFEIYLNKSQMLWVSCELDAAWQCLNQGLNLFPNNYWLQIKRIEFSLQLGQFGAVQQFINSCPADTLDKRIHLQIFSAQLAEKQWQLDTAIEIYQTIIKQRENHIPSHYALRRLYMLKLDFVQAKHHALMTTRYRLGEQKINGQSGRAHLHDHIARMTDEYLFNKSILEQVKHATSLEPQQRLNMLAELIQQEPCNAVANTFLMELRQQQFFTQGIPKRIFQYWDKSTLPGEVLKFTQSWTKHNPDYLYQLFNDQTAQEFLRAHYEPKVLRAYFCTKHAAQKADLLRLALLYKYGGIYADADDMCLKPLIQWLPKDIKILFYQDEYATVVNNFIACIPNHPVIKLALDYALENLLRGDKDSIWLSTGPAMVSRALALYLAQNWSQSTPKELGVMVITREELMQVVGIHGQLSYKRTNDSWLIKEFQSGKKFELSKIIER